MIPFIHPFQTPLHSIHLQTDLLLSPDELRQRRIIQRLQNGFFGPDGGQSGNRTRESLVPQQMMIQMMMMVQMIQMMREMMVEMVIESRRDAAVESQVTEISVESVDVGRRRQMQLMLKSRWKRGERRRSGRVMIDVDGSVVGVIRDVDDVVGGGTASDDDRTFVSTGQLLGKVPFDKLLLLLLLLLLLMMQLLLLLLVMIESDVAERGVGRRLRRMMESHDVGNCGVAQLTAGNGGNRRDGAWRGGRRSRLISD